MLTIEARRDSVVRGLADRVTLHGVAADDAIARAEKEKFVARIHAKDSSLWKSDDAHRKTIDNALGWLPVIESMQRNAKGIVELTDELRRNVNGGFDHVVVLGMGGSSLCAEVVRRVFGHMGGRASSPPLPGIVPGSSSRENEAAAPEAATGTMPVAGGLEARAPYPELLVLDSTVPEAVRMLEARIDVAKTLFIVASKSGSTTEPMMFHRYFYDRVKSVKGERAGENFIAVTDPDTQLVADAQRDNFRQIFVNRADIGGRYSALSFFGLVPMALTGVDIVTLLDRALHAVHVSHLPQVRKNAPALLGAAIGGAALQGRDKLTLITPRPLDTLGLWVEQLIAESTGKEGKGIVPIAGEPALNANEYGNDRLFVAVRLRGSDETQRLRELAAAGHPVIDIVLEDPLDLGEIFFLFEFATAVAGAILGVNPFDQPNVQESKDNTKSLLAEFTEKGTMAGAGGPAGKRVEVSETDAIASLLASVKPGDYVALTQYFGETISRDEKIAAIRLGVARELRVATTSGYGPRFLHSTGQLHKGGGDNGVFLQLTGGAREDVPIPGEKFGFGALVRAQAIGDFQSLVTRGRRAVSIDLGEDVDAGLEQLAQAVKMVKA
jgi:glucose-6-phosphate isomerase